MFIRFRIENPYYDSKKPKTAKQDSIYAKKHDPLNGRRNKKYGFPKKEEEIEASYLLAFNEACPP